MFCKKCGSKIDEGNSFCSNCGEKVEVNNVNQTISGGLDSGVVQPVQQPVVQPVEQPVQQPVEQPVEQPVQQPVEQPVYQAPIQKEKNTGKIILICLLVAVVLILVILAILFATGIIKIGSSNSNSIPNNNNNNNNRENKVVEKTYQIGDAVSTVDGSKWHVIGVKGDTYTLLLDELVVDETGYGSTRAEENQKYVNSEVKKYIDETYMPDLKNKIEAAGGDSSEIVGRLITIEEFFELTGTEFNDSYTSSTYTHDTIYDSAALKQSCEIQKIMSMTKSFWTASNLKDYDPSNNYYGAIYIHLEEGREDTICKYNNTIWAFVDFAASGRAGYGATLVGIRPVIETPSSNIK